MLISIVMYVDLKDPRKSHIIGGFLSFDEAVTEASLYFSPEDRDKVTNDLKKRGECEFKDVFVQIEAFNLDNIYGGRKGKSNSR